jgi:hypothetical protein
MPQNYLHLGLSQTTQDDTVHYIQTALSARSQVLFQVKPALLYVLYHPNHPFQTADRAERLSCYYSNFQGYGS